MADEPLPNQVPDIALPDLKKRQKEKKRAGAAWIPGQATEAFEGATGGVGEAAASAAARVATLAGEAALEGAAGEAGLVARLLAPLARLGGTLGGRLALGLAAALLVGGAGAVAARMMGLQVPGVSLNLGGVASNVKARSDDPSGLDYARGTGRGLSFGDAARAAHKLHDDAPGAAGGPEGKDGPNPPPGDVNNPFGERPDQDKLAHNLSGAKLSQTLGSGGSGGHFASPQAAGKFNDPLGFGKSGANVGKAAPLQRAGMYGSRALNLGRRGIRSNRAIGQLKSMYPLTGPMTTAKTAESAGTTATEQFEGANAIGAEAPTTPAALDGTTPTTPTLAPTGCTSDDPTTCGYSTPPHVDMTKALGDLVTQAQSMIDKAVAMLLAMSVVILVMEAIAAFWFPTCCSWVGAIFWGIAVLLAVAAVMLCKMLAGQLHQQADAIRQAGTALASDGGKSPQANAIADEVDKMGKDVGSASLTILLGGLGGFIAAHKVAADNDALQKMAQGIEDKGNTPGDHMGGADHAGGDAGAGGGSAGSMGSGAGGGSGGGSTATP